MGDGDGRQEFADHVVNDRAVLGGPVDREGDGGGGARGLAFPSEAAPDFTASFQSPEGERLAVSRKLIQMPPRSVTRDCFA